MSKKGPLARWARSESGDTDPCQAAERELLSEDHFTVDGRLIAAWASRRSFVPKEPPPRRGTGIRGRKLLRDTHESTTDAQARLYKRSAGGKARPSYLGHVLLENRHDLVVAACATQSPGLDARA